MSGSVAGGMALESLAEPVTSVRPLHLAERVVIVDGLPGCGKTMMTPIIAGLDRVELPQYCYPLEYTCALRHLGRIEPDGAAVLIRLLTDLQLYNVMMSREVNFRWNDLSGVRLAPQPWRYVRRLFQPGDEAIPSRIQRERPVLNLVTHLLLGISRPIFDALAERVRVVEVVRHPLYMLKQQYQYMPRWGTDAREFSVWFDHHGRALPWFARGWEAPFAAANPMDRTIYLIDRMQRLIDATVAALPPRQQAQVLVIPFERFVIEPWPYMEQLERLLDTRVTAVTRRAMRAQRVPRRMYAQGIGLPIYKANGWEPPKAGTEAEEFARRRSFAEAEASPAAMQVLDRLCEAYEARHLTGAAA